MSVDKLYIAVDIEKSGSMLARHPIIAIGLVAGDSKGNVIDTMKVCFNFDHPILNGINGDILDYGSFEPRCWNEFWVKNLDILKSLYTEGKTPLETEHGCLTRYDDTINKWKKVYEWVDDLSNKHNKNVAFVTDNPSFDIASIDYAFEHYLNKTPLRTLGGTAYVNVINSSDMFRTLPNDVKDKCKVKINSKVIHDHNPCNDAMVHYYKYVSYVSYVNKDIPSL